MLLLESCWFGSKFKKKLKYTDEMDREQVSELFITGRVYPYTPNIYQEIEEDFFYEEVIYDFAFCEYRMACGQIGLEITCKLVREEKSLQKIDDISCCCLTR